MRISLVRSAKWLASAFFLVSWAALPLAAQVNTAAPRITQAINNSDRVALRGNVSPLARPQFDRGIAPASLPMERMMLLLKRSPQQEAALEALLARQQDRQSPDYHRWLTPAQFGAEFGPSDQDIQTVEAWLESQGFSVDSVSKGRTIIEFSGSAGEVQSAFHTQVHGYVLPTGAQHWANSTNPEIPAALAPVVSSIHGLNNFFPKPLSRIVSEVRAARPASHGKAQPQFTFAASGPCSAVQGYENDPNPICFMIAPSDFATIYNINPLYSAGIDGTGETIAIANDSNINLTDISTFRSLMSLPAKNPNVIFATGTDPGVNSDESEAALDVEWSGAIAKNATIDLVIAPSTTVSFGGDLAAEYIVDNNLAPILSYSFGACETSLGSSGNSFYNSLWQQAAAEGITVLVASGDNGSAACDVNVVNGPASQPAQNGLQVNGLASTPYNVAVGGTDFNDVSNPGSYWNTNDSSSTAQSSALGYVPETTWNESCTNAVFSTTLSAQFGNTPEAACNNATLANGGFVVPTGGAGGASGVYAKPSWQSALTPSDGQRDIPDISVFAGTGAISASFYYLCESDLSNPPATCSFSGQIYGVGGTSVSAQVMAGIVALIDQKTGGPQGNINPVLYTLAGQGSNSCASAANPASTCMFYDVTAGTNSMPCATNSQDCYTATNGDTVGILADTNHNPAYDAATGYDLATGLGSINVDNLANASGAWATASTAPDFSITSSNPTVTIGSNHQGTMSITITPQNGFTGTLNLSCPGLPTGDTCSFSPASPVTISGATTVTVTVAGTIASVPGRLNGPAGPGAWPTGTQVTFAFACLAALLLFGLRLRQRRWNVALALVAFTLLVIAGCGGNSSSSSGGGGGGTTGTPFTTSLTATTCTTSAGCTGGTTHSLVFTVQ